MPPAWHLPGAYKPPSSAWEQHSYASPFQAHCMWILLPTKGSTRVADEGGGGRDTRDPKLSKSETYLAFEKENWKCSPRACVESEGTFSRISNVAYTMDGELSPRWVCPLDMGMGMSADRTTLGEQFGTIYPKFQCTHPTTPDSTSRNLAQPQKEIHRTIFTIEQRELVKTWP